MSTFKAIFNLTMRSAGCSAYADQPSCDADNVTDAGCTWCDVVDRPPFCSSIFEAREQPLPPQGPPFTCSKYAPIGESTPTLELPLRDARRGQRTGGAAW